MRATVLLDVMNCLFLVPQWVAVMNGVEVLDVMNCSFLVPQWVTVMNGVERV